MIRLSPEQCIQAFVREDEKPVPMLHYDRHPWERIEAKELKRRLEEDWRTTPCAYPIGKKGRP